MLLLLLDPGSELLPRIPVPEHLDGQDNVQGEAAEETVEDDGVVDLGDGREDAGKGAEEVVEDLWRYVRYLYFRRGHSAAKGLTAKAES